MSRSAAGRTSSEGYLLLGSALFLLLIGLVAIYSASSVADYVKLGDSAYHLKRQSLFVAAGVAALFVASRWDFRKRRGVSSALTPDNVAWGAWIASIAGLLLVAALGVTRGGATSWIEIAGVSVQPSEYVKLACVLLVAALLLRYDRGELRPGEVLTRLLVVVLVPVALVMAQPDMGTTVSIAISVFFVLWLGGARARWLAAIVAVSAPAAVLLVWVAGYRMARFESFLDPWSDPLDSGYQIIQSLYAFGSGGLTGVGLGLSRQKFFYLPAAHTDFIYAIIGEELGLLGALVVLAAFGVFTYAGLRIAMRVKDRYARLMAGGLTAMIASQALMNMAAVTGLMPITGIPLPLVSYGGSSMTFTLGCIGLILAADRYGGVASRPLAAVLTRAERGHRSADSAERRRNGGARVPRVDRGRTTARRGA